MTQPRMLIAIAALLLAGAAAPPAARAQQPDVYGRPTTAAGQEQLELGNRFYRVKEFQKAIEAYKAGAVKEEAPVFYFNLGQCHRQLGEYKEAIWYFERWISKKRPPEGDQLLVTVRGLIQEMKDEMAQAARSRPPIEPGPQEPRETGADDRPSEPSPKLVSTPTRDTPAWYSDKLGWSILGGGVLLAGVGTGFLISAAGLEEDANSEPNEVDRLALRDKASGRRTIGAVATVIGGAAVVGGIIKLVLRPERSQPDATALRLLFDGRTLALQGSF